MTTIIINLIIAHIDVLTRREQELTRRINAGIAGTAHTCYLIHRRDVTVSEKATLSAMLRVYLAAGNVTNNRRRAA